MATTTLQNLRRELSQRIGGTNPTFFATSTNLTTTTVIVADALRNAGYGEDDYFNEWWTIILGTNNSQTVRRIKDYAGTTGTLTVGGTALSSESAAKDFELHKHNPTFLRDILNDARLDAFPLLHQVVVSQTLFVGPDQQEWAMPSNIVGAPRQVFVARRYSAEEYNENLLTNGGFETWTNSTTVGTWTTSGSPTINQEEDTTTPTNLAVLQDANSLKFTAPSSAEATVEQDISSPGTHSGLELTFSVWVYCLVASRLKARITWNSTSADSVTHLGNGWEKLSVTTQPNLALTNLDFKIVCTSGTQIVVYMDEAIATAGYSRPTALDYDPILNWNFDNTTVAANEPAGLSTTGILRIPYKLESGRQLRIVGMNYLSSVSAETDTMEIAMPHNELLYAYAKVRLYSYMKAASGPSNRDVWEDILREAVAERKRLQRTRRMIPPKRLVNAPDWGL